MKWNTSRALGWLAAVVSILVPPICLSPITLKMLPQRIVSSDLAYLAVWTMAVGGSILMAKLIHRVWYLLTA
jgi:hypothetical protein